MSDGYVWNKMFRRNNHGIGTSMLQWDWIRSFVAILCRIFLYSNVYVVLMNFSSNLSYNETWPLL